MTTIAASAANDARCRVTPTSIELQAARPISGYGVTADEIKGALMQVAVTAGGPAANAAFGIAKDVV